MPTMYESTDSLEFRKLRAERNMISRWTTNEESVSAEWMREMRSMESEGEVTQRLPVICPEAFEVSTLTDSEVRAALAAEFGEQMEAA